MCLHKALINVVLVLICTSYSSQECFDGALSWSWLQYSIGDHCFTTPLHSFMLHSLGNECFKGMKSVDLLRQPPFSSGNMPLCKRKYGFIWCVLLFKVPVFLAL